VLHDPNDVSAAAAADAPKGAQLSGVAPTPTEGPKAGGSRSGSPHEAVVGAGSDVHGVWPVVPVTELVECPTHGRPLMFMIPAAHAAVKKKNFAEYPCALEHNEVFRQLCCTAEERDVKCKYDDFLVCPDDACGFCICSQCYRGGIIGPLVEQRKYVFKQQGTMSIVGLLVIFGAQLMYTPTVRAAALSLFCHVSMACEPGFEVCFPATAAYMGLAYVSAIVLLLMGLGMVVALWVMIYRRKKMIVFTGIIAEHLRLNGEPWTDQEKSFWNILNAECDNEVWDAMMSLDSSMLKEMYAQYRFAHMCIHPFTFVVKAAILVIVLYAGEPNSLRLIAGVGFVETVYCVMLLLTHPFLNPWIEALAKCGAIHQMMQVGLVSYHRAANFLDPKNQTAAYGMIAITVFFIGFAIVVVVMVIGVPACNKEEMEDDQKKREEAGGGAAAGAAAVGAAAIAVSLKR